MKVLGSHCFAVIGIVCPQEHGLSEIELYPKAFLLNTDEGRSDFLYARNAAYREQLPVVIAAWSFN